MSATNYKPAFSGFFAGRLTACSNHQNLKQSTLNSLELALTTFGFGFFMGTTSSTTETKRKNAMTMVHSLVHALRDNVKSETSLSPDHPRLLT